MEEDLIKVDDKIAGLTVEKQKMLQEKPTDMHLVMGYLCIFWNTQIIPMYPAKLGI